MSLPKTCWLLFDAEKKGSENQCRGLAEALGLTSFHLKPLAKSRILKLLPRSYWFSFLCFQKGLLRDINQESLPDLIISSGTRASVVSAFLKRQSDTPLKVINILNPRLPHGFFDLIIAPEHDRLTGPNILPMRGSLTSVTPEKLTHANGQKPLVLAKPVVTLLLGGPSKAFKMNKAHFERLGQQVAHLYRAQNAHFLISFSRRTPPSFKEIFLQATKRIPLEIYDPQHTQGENPYLFYLSVADHVIVSADSISMVVDACTTGKPVYVMGFDKMPRKFHQFHNALEAQGSIRFFKGSLEKWTAVPLHETQRLAQEVRQRLF